MIRIFERLRALPPAIYVLFLVFVLLLACHLILTSVLKRPDETVRTLLATAGGGLLLLCQTEYKKEGGQTISSIDTPGVSVKTEVQE